MDKTVGVLGGGQLGRMLAEAANRLNIKLLSLDSEGAPTKQICAHSDHVTGSFRDHHAVQQLAEKCDVLTVEIEHVDTYALQNLPPRLGTPSREDVDIQPAWQTIRKIQDKYVQKEHLLSHNISTAQSIKVDENNLQGLEKCSKELGLPFMLKSRTEAYDGRGNFPVRSNADLPIALEALKGRPLYAEKWAHFTKELAVMVVKVKNAASSDWRDSTKAFPVVETVHEDSICKLVYAPARHVARDVMDKARELACRAVATFTGKGVFGVEMFLLPDGDLLINEIAPRPHNSGHYTIEACPLSQYDAHLRAILDLPVPDASLDFIGENTNAIMVNILGGVRTDTHLLAAREAMSVPGARIHLYGKGDSRPGRKMGHVTVIADSMDSAENRIQPLVTMVDHIRLERTAKSRFKDSGTAKSDLQQDQALERGARPVVAVTMGSDSDRFVLAPGIKLLQDLGIPHLVTITSAHRTPQRMVTFAETAASRGIKVIIAAAGGAAHLPGMVAANTWLPVIGVPVKASNLEGLDSLLSIVQMPRGCPVASVAINNSVNAAQLAARILSLDDAKLQEKLKAHLQDQTESVEEKAKRMEIEGFDKYSASD